MNGLQKLATYFSRQARMSRQIEVMDHYLNNLSYRNFQSLLTLGRNLTLSFGHDPAMSTALLSAVDRIASGKTHMSLDRACGLAATISNSANFMRSRVSREFTVYAATANDHDDKSGRMADYLQRVKPRDLALEGLEKTAAQKWEQSFRDIVTLRLAEGSDTAATRNHIYLDMRIMAMMTAGGAGYYLRKGIETVSRDMDEKILPATPVRPAP